MSLREIKQHMRRQALAARRAVPAALAAAAPHRAARLLDVLGPALDRAPGGVASGYWPVRGEFDPRPMLDRLAGRAFVRALPVVTGRGRPLAFRGWNPGEPLTGGAFGIERPLDRAPALVPDLVLAPLLAFDDAGGRLGYGGGYYDRTLRGLRRRTAVLVIGVGFDAQRVDSVPCGDGDEPLDWVITESRAVECRRCR